MRKKDGHTKPWFRIKGVSSENILCRDTCFEYVNVIDNFADLRPLFKSLSRAFPLEYAEVKHAVTENSIPLSALKSQLQSSSFLRMSL